MFEWKDGTWHHTEASRFLRSDDPCSLRDYVRMLGLPVFWSAFEDLDHSLRTGESAFAKRHAGGVFEYLAKNPEESRIFDAAMTSKSHRDIAAILPAYDFYGSARCGQGFAASSVCDRIAFAWWSR